MWCADSRRTPLAADREDLKECGRHYTRFQKLLRRPGTRSSQWFVSDSGQTEAEAVLEHSPVVFESAYGRIEPIEDRLNQHRQDAALR